ncbi:DUF2388 domain-containing protein [Bdellovibrio sp. NC01]|uniref:DUF2388 domain-containing protein n=1 Tax=Bdellovibrio sp. NC01 TaxID=2220073 RepID=UPI00115B7D02|nr:DUF2388 domain-containing protein [Bdellovibrio sp. NC01]QDK38384.1 hypothetical protein DOE51_12740 [Bdellovibrio sp. NC01]
MKSLVLSASILLAGIAAVAHPGHYHGGGCYNCGRSDANDVASILSAYSGSLLLTSASMCADGPGCYYKEIIVESKDDAALYLATGGEQKGVKLTRALEVLRQMDPSNTSSDEKLAQDILNY